MNNIKKSLKNFFDLCSKERYTIGTSVARVGLGMIIIYNYLIIYFQREIIFGVNGLVGQSAENISIYKFISDNTIFQIVFHLGLIVAFLYTIGFYINITGVINYIFTFSFINQGFLMTDGGDNLLILLLFYLLFANTTTYFAVIKSKRNSELRSIIHNFAVYACIIQICIVYFVSALYQVNGEKWFNGTALYYITQVDIFSNPNLDFLLTNNDIVMSVLTYFSVIIKIAFPFLIFNKNIKLVIVLLIIMFHIGIGIFMGLVTFALTMILAESLLFTDSEYRKANKILNRIRFKFQRKGFE
ncbi:HTTM domain-containing protein [Staphylococcus schweitzeri]|uniref:Antimicrobial peptide system protein, SdpB family n=1 Tax=Staphylococcus schweitzeri TaxID=1654388 RepID=A0A077UNC1_9STAP|nr:HTTM domain-containing protein [Staphylococcus schweitzeri]CDR29228.1 antimicrobial peptide system protein%2C SdpB family [Staphylococcus schweitzeri]